MSVSFACPCGIRLTVPDELAGRDVRCPKCGGVARAPEAIPIAEVIPEAVPMAVPAPPAPRAPRRASRRDADVNHAGESLPHDAEFFAPPPEEIGSVISGDTTLRKHHRPWPAWAVATTTLLGTVLGLLASIVAIYATGTEWWLWMTCWIIFGLLIGTVVGFFISNFMHTCTYVGTQGVATLSCMGARDKLDPPKLFLFKNADDLWTVITNHYKLGVRVRTSWCFEWKTRDGKSVQRWSGTYWDKEPGTSEEYYLARAAAGAWEEFMYERLADQFARGERVRFVMKRPGDWIELTRGSITFCIGSSPVTWTRDEIDKVDLTKEDAIVFKHQRRKEGVFSSEGVYTIKVHEVANAETFFRLLPDATGLTVG